MIFRREYFGDDKSVRLFRYFIIPTWCVIDWIDITPFEIGAPVVPSPNK